MFHLLFELEPLRLVSTVSGPGCRPSPNPWSTELKGTAVAHVHGVDRFLRIFVQLFGTLDCNPLQDMNTFDLLRNSRNDLQTSLFLSYHM